VKVGDTIEINRFRIWKTSENDLFIKKLSSKGGMPIFWILVFVGLSAFLAYLTYQKWELDFEVPYETPTFYGSLLMLAIAITGIYREYITTNKLWHITSSELRKKRFGTFKKLIDKHSLEQVVIRKVEEVDSRSHLTENFYFELYLKPKGETQSSKFIKLLELDGKITLSSSIRKSVSNTEMSKVEADSNQIKQIIHEFWRI
jgi:hypothetical protein